ncbi:MAG: acyl-CoA thioesterase [Gammaproteobacteria bacterium]|nr:acyl-CoA thioesterase [Gammaproteobacteria bacterium]
MARQNQQGSKALLAQYPVVIKLDVRWGDMDAFGHVNNIVYLQYFESVRIAYFERLEFSSIEGIGPILASTECRYKIPLTYPDIISVGAKVVALGADRLTQHYAVFSHRHQRIAAEGQGVIVAYDYGQNKKAQVPEVIKNRLREIEGETALPTAK